MNGNPNHCATCGKPAIVDGEVQFDLVLLGERDGVFVYGCEDCSEAYCDDVLNGMEPPFVWTRACEVADAGITITLTHVEAFHIVNLLTAAINDNLVFESEQNRLMGVVRLLEDALPY